MQEFCCRWAPSLGELESTHQDVWGTKDYVYSEDKYKPTVFFGLYDLRDYLALIRHKGPRYILWAGSDIKNLVNQFYLNDGKLKWLSRILPFSNLWLRKFISTKCVSYVENQIEATVLSLFNIYPLIEQSFLGDINKYQITYKQSDRPQVYLSCSGGRTSEYGFGGINWLAPRIPFADFHLYGAPFTTQHNNVIVHGRIPKEQMNEEIKHMQCGLRMNVFDGFSEITAKSALWGQYPASIIKYPKITHLNFIDDLGDILNDLRYKKEPNYEVRNHYLKTLNTFPWNANYNK